MNVSAELGCRKYKFPPNNLFNIMFRRTLRKVVARSTFIMGKRVSKVRNWHFPASDATGSSEPLVSFLMFYGVNGFLTYEDFNRL